MNVFPCILSIIFLLKYCFGTFTLNFQSHQDLSTDEWAEHLGTIPLMEEFTSCFWEKLRHFATDYTAVWGYCKQKSTNGASIKCTQFYHRGSPLTVNRHINIYGWLDGTTEVTVKIPKYLHRTWHEPLDEFLSFSCIFCVKSLNHHTHF